MELQKDQAKNFPKLKFKNKREGDTEQNCSNWWRIQKVIKCNL